MRLTVTVNPRTRAVRLQVDRALDYPPVHVTGLLAAAAAQALAHQVADDAPGPATGEVSHPVPAPRAAADDVAAPRGTGAAVGDEARLRRRVLRALDDGATVEQAAARFGINPAVIDRWDDDPAADAHTDLLADGFGWPDRRAAS